MTIGELQGWFEDTVLIPLKSTDELRARETYLSVVRDDKCIAFIDFRDNMLKPVTLNEEARDGDSPSE